MAPAGELRSRVVLWLPQEAADGFGGVRTTHAAGPALWARVTPLRATSASIRARRSLGILHSVRKTPFAASFRRDFAMRAHCAARFESGDAGSFFERRFRGG